MRLSLDVPMNEYQANNDEYIMRKIIDETHPCRCDCIDDEILGLKKVLRELLVYRHPNSRFCKLIKLAIKDLEERKPLNSEPDGSTHNKGYEVNQK